MIVIQIGGLQIPFYGRPGNPPRPGASLAGVNFSPAPTRYPAGTPAAPHPTPVVYAG